MNSDYIQNSVATKELNKFSYRPYPLNEEPYFKLKDLNYHKKWDKVFEPYDFKQPLKQFIIGHCHLIMVCLMRDSHI